MSYNKNHRLTLALMALMVFGVTSALAAPQFAPADASGRYVYLVEFTDPGLLEQHREQRDAGQRFDYQAPAVASARESLMTQQQQHLARMAQHIGRNVSPTHFYLVSHSGIAARLTPAEAREIARMPAVASVRREQLHDLATYRGPTFINADDIWNGSAVPGGTPYDGAGMVAAILDSGIPDTAHDSFANDPACGHGTTFPNKVLSSLDCSSTDGSGVCNGASPGDTNGHGSHTASTVAGNRLDAGSSPSPAIPAPFTEMSGVAPCAHVRSYKVCPGQSCPGADIQAGMDSVLIHGDVDVMNFSISGGASPWLDNDRRKLDLVDQGIFVAASAGNTSTAVPDPVGQVNHRGPWVMSVAASTRDGDSIGIVSMTGPGTPPANTQGIAMDRGSASPVGSPLSNHPILFDPSQPAGADGCNPGFAADFFDGATALIQRGTCGFTEKINNAATAGADLVIIWNNVTDPLSMDTTGQDPSTPAYSISLSDGQALHDFIDGNPGATADFLLEAAGGDVLADFSFRGPTAAPLQDLQKPDITGPGVDIYAAVPGGYANISGTSMSGPHIAGAGLLVAQSNPDWTPSEIKSALQMTASKAGFKEDGTTPWDWDDVGNGRADLSGAALAGLVMDETFQNYLDANPSTGGDIKTVNVPAVRNLDCTPNCTWTRTVRNTLGTASSWTAAGAGISGAMDIDVSPSTFSFTGGLAETQELTITVTPLEDLTGSIAFGEVTLTEDAAQSPELHLTVAISGEPGGPIGPAIEVAPAFFDFVMNPDTTSSQNLNIANTGIDPLNWTIETEDTTAAIRSPREFDGDFDIANWTLVNTPAGVNGSFNTNAGPPIELFVIGGDAFVGGTTDFEITVPGNGDISFDWGYQSADSSDFDDGGYVINGVYTELANTDAQIPFFNGSETVAVAAGDVFAFRASTDDGEFGSGDLGVTNFEFTPAVCDDIGAITWLSVTPDNGTTAAGGDDDVSVDIDTTGLADGVYEANLCISSDASNESLVVVPVTVTVQAGTIDPPTIDAAPLSLSYNLIAGETDGDDLTIGNLGDELLTWNIATAEAAGAGHFPQGGDIVVFDEIDFTPNADFTGGAVEWFTGSTCDCDAAPFDFNVWNTTMSFFFPNNGTEDSGAVSLDGSTTYAVLQPGDTVGAGDDYIASTASAASGNWRQAGDVEGYLGFRFENPNTSVTNYGYAHISTTGTTGHPVTIHGWAFDQTGADIEIVTGGPAGCDNPAAISWLNVDPISGSTVGGGNSTVAVSVDSTGLDGGIYEALLCVSSNDPTTPLVEVPVTLDVTGAPEIDVDPASISMSLEPDATDSADVTIANLGEATLDWEVDESPAAAGSVLRTGAATIPETMQAQPSAGLVQSAHSVSAKPASALAIGDFDLLGGGGTVLTHSASQAITPANSVACSPDSGATTSVNAFLRTFTLGDFGIGGPFDVSEVSFGIENLSVAADVDVNLYSLDGAFTYANMSPIGTATASLAAQTETVVAVPVSGTVPAGGTLVVEIVPPDLSGTGAYFPGSNSAGETAPSFIASSSCSIVDPVTYASIGFAQVQLVVNVTGAASFDCALPGWVSNIAPQSGSLAGSASEPMTVTLDSTGLSPDTYTANVCLSSNDPVTPVTVIPVELQVGLGPDDSQLTGTVASLGYCSDDPSLIEGAAIEVVGDSGAIFNTTTDANGDWEVILDASETPVDITASAPDHLDGAEIGIGLVAQGTTVVDFDLVLDQACATANPESIAASLPSGDSTVVMLEIDNADGGAEMTWDIFTAEVATDTRAHFPAVPYTAAPVNDPDASMLVDASTISAGPRGANGLLGGPSVLAYSTTGFAAQGYISMDALVPGTVNIINATQPATVYAATFIDNDFSQHYMLTTTGGALPGDTLGTTDTATGVFASLGAITGAPTGNSWASMKWDHSTQTLYALNSAGAGLVDLYTIDPDTLEATLVGPVDGAGVDPAALIVAIAIAPDGLMYGLDIAADVLLAIDKETGEAAAIGPTGLNANFAQDMDFDQTTGVLYWPAYLGGGATEMTTVDTGTGAATSIGVISSQNEMLSFTVASEGQAPSCTEPAAVTWLSVDPITGTIPPGGSEMAEVTLDSTGLANGSYEAFVCVETSDPDNDLISVPVFLNVIEDAMFEDSFEQ